MEGAIRLVLDMKEPDKFSAFFQPVMNIHKYSRNGQHAHEDY
jgi:hypothetical protein